MSMMKTTKRILIYLLVQVFIFVNACFASGEVSVREKGKDCLSPRLKIQTDALSRVFTILIKRGNITRPRDVKHKEDGLYNLFLAKLVNQVGTADELLENIKKDYADEFAEPINMLEQIEKKYVMDGGGAWVIEHEKEVMLMSYCMGMILGFRKHHLAQIAFAARFHDIGKCKIDPRMINDERLFSDSLLLTQEERKIIYNEINKHTASSEDILRVVGIKDELILSIVFCHHANVDGSGYPASITRQEIPLETKITRVIDSFSAMLGRRLYFQPYKQLFQGAVQEIESNVYSFYGPRAVTTFLSMLRDEKITNRRAELYQIPVWEGGIFRGLLKEAEKIEFVYPFAKVACGISNSWNEKPYSIAVNSIGTHRHAEVNLVLKVLDEHLRRQGLRKSYIEELKNLEFLAYSSELNHSAEALVTLGKISQITGNPFKNKVIYTTLRPCAACFKLLSAIGVKEIYYGSEHPDPEFIRKSETAAKELRQNGMRIAQAHFPNEGVLEPNRLFFSFCNQPGYEKITGTINSWFAEIIKQNDMRKLPIDTMREKEREFVNMIDNLLGDLEVKFDLEQVNTTLQRRKNIMRHRVVKEYGEKASLGHYYLIRQAI